MTYLRRKFLKVGLMGAAAMALPLGTLSIPLTRLGASASVRSPSVQPFRVPLPIPPVLKPGRPASFTSPPTTTPGARWTARIRAWATTAAGTGCSSSTR